MTCQAGSPGYDCTFSVQGAAGEDGRRGIAIVVADLAGNQGRASASVELDFTAPAVVSSSADPSPAKNGAVITYRVTLSEAVVNTPVLSTGGLTWTGPTQSGNTYTWTHTVGAAESGTYAAALDQLTDLAGNSVGPVSAGMAGLVIDATPPSVSLATVSPTLVKAGQDVTVTFTSSEALSADPTVRLGALSMSKSAQAGNEYTYKYTTTGAEGDGTRTVSVQLTDVAGNVGGAVLSETVELDFTAPSVVSSSADPSPAKNGAVITYRVTLSEAIANTPVLSTRADLDGACEERQHLHLDPHGGLHRERQLHRGPG